MIDNFELIKPLLKFDNEDEFYFLQVIQRKKDRKDVELDVKYVGSNNHSRLIKAYYIYSVEQLEKYKPEIIALCEMFKARAGINLNRRNNKDMAFDINILLAECMKQGDFHGLSKLYNTVCGQAKGKDKTWLIDIDIKDELYLRQISSDIAMLEPFGDKVIETIPSKSGFHLITRSFNSKDFGKIYPDVEIHRNNPTNLYIS